MSTGKGVWIDANFNFKEVDIDESIKKGTAIRSEES